MIPCLSGFIDSWNPFPGDQRYFDIPPSQQAALGGRGDEPASHKVPDEHCFGFSFQKDVSGTTRSGHYLNSILLLFKIKDRCKKVRFQQTHNQGLRQLLLTVSWDLRA